MEKIKQGDNILDLKKWVFKKNRKAFSDIATEIRSGKLQVPLVTDDCLFGQTDKILHFALKGKELPLESPEYQARLGEYKQEILKAVGKIIEKVSKMDIKNMCPECSMNTSAEKIRLLAEQVR